MLKIQVDGNKCRIYGIIPKRTKEDLDEMMRFHPLGFEHSKKYQLSEWDGYFHLFHTEWQKFPRGFLGDVATLLELDDVDYCINDKTKLKGFRKLDLRFNGELYPYQEIVSDTLVVKRRGIASLPTGSGKTVIACHLISRIGLSCCIYVNKLELQRQWVDMLCHFLFLSPEDIGLVGVGKVEIKPITVAMVQTVSKLPKELFSCFGQVHVDECHCVPSDTVYDIMKKTKSKYLIGYSATPTREDNKMLMLKGAIGNIVVDQTVSRLIAQRYLARPTIYIEPVRPMTFSRKIPYSQVYRDAVVTNEERNERIRNIAQKYGNRGKSVYIHVKQVKHGKLLNSMIPGSVFIYGKDTQKRREEVLNNFKENGGVLISTLLGEGVDVKKMDVLIFGTPFKSLIATKQVFGRVLRITADKKEVKVFDFADSCKFLFNHFKRREEWYASEEAFILIY